IGFFAPHAPYSASGTRGEQVAEFKGMVKALHRAGIEVILDVVYNHTAEGNHLGPTFSFKGIDNAAYYRLSPDDKRYYFDYTGTGNTLDVRNPQVLALIMDSLRYWATEMHVDGFRFDLASALARGLHEVAKLSVFFTSIHQSPELSRVKLIAEPWDVGEGGYQVGNFPVRWAEWNGRYRDAIRRFWGRGENAGDVGYRITGSSDLYEQNARKPSASINFVTAHDGLTLHDWAAYHDDDGNRAIAARQVRNLAATLLLSQGTPMIVAGDELGRTQRGNDNAYCEDNEVSWFSWSWTDEQRALFAFVKKLIALRHDHPALRRSSFFRGEPVGDGELRDLGWFGRDGAPCRSAEDGTRASFALFIAGRGLDDVDEHGMPVVDDDLLWILNASAEDVDFRIPATSSVRSWELLVDTSNDAAREKRAPGDTTRLPARSLKLFRAPSRIVRSGGLRHTLGATYRVQLDARFDLWRAASIADYVAEMGFTDLYVSPIMAAAPGSTHGYDVVDHTRIDPKLGGREALESLSEELRAKDLGLLVDWVPNHMGIAEENVAWRDVLENGPSSIHADQFDIAWRPPKEALADRVLLPILATTYGEALERGEIQIAFVAGELTVVVGARKLPVAPKSSIDVLERVASTAELADDDDARLELESIVRALKHLPDLAPCAIEDRKERSREKAVLKRRIARLVAGDERVARAIDVALATFNGERGVPASFDALDAFLRKQCYRLASWKVAVEEINYRRFFDINDLAAIRMESREVFDATHGLLFDLIQNHRIQALRLDHTDGLRDPKGYFEKLQRVAFPAPPPQGTTPDDAARPLPILIEKILGTNEKLPPAWSIDGSTGYDFLGAMRGVFVDPAAERAITEQHRSFTQDLRTYGDHVRESKDVVLRFSLASEVHMLATELEAIASRSRRFSDFTRMTLTRALVEVIAAFPVYRTYLAEEDGSASAEDRRYISAAVATAAKRDTTLAPDVLRFIEDVLLMRIHGSDADVVACRAFAARF
ncbi:MAG TPA: alpha-amylase family glycosyl hydrolase, partial [Polyangiaceae bacterium]|nr:alpha-amylase family glycosyl hydrolase [Polyangiaceae bacterium]